MARCSYRCLADLQSYGFFFDGRPCRPREPSYGGCQRLAGTDDTPLRRRPSRTLAVYSPSSPQMVSALRRACVPRRLYPPLFAFLVLLFGCLEPHLLFNSLLSPFVLLTEWVALVLRVMTEADLGYYRRAEHFIFLSFYPTLHLSPKST